MHLGDRQVDHVRSLGSARTMWDHLQQLHQPSDGTTKIFSYRTLMSMDMREGEPTNTFISNWQRQLDAAISAGNIIDETSKCEILMGSLPESWITFVSIHSNESQSPNLDGEKSRKTNYEERNQMVKQTQVTWQWRRP